MKEIKKIIIFLVMILMVFTVNCYATSCSEIEDSAASFKKIGEDELSKLNSNSDITGEVTNKTAPIINMLMYAGILIIGICMVILGIQWVMAKSSPEEQAKLKNKFFGVAISAAILFGSFTIWKVLITILDSIDG